jgi:hypothetical protein
MAPTRGKDKVPRKRRANTARELEEKRQKRLFNAGGRGQPTICGQRTIAFAPPTADGVGVAPAANDEGSNNMIDASVVDMPVEVEIVRAVHCGDVDDPDDEIDVFYFSADYDDGNNPDERGGGREGGRGLMHRLCFQFFVKRKPINLSMRCVC